MAMLRARGCYAVKIHGGPTMAAGTPDILACVPVGVDRAVPDGIGITAQEDVVGVFIGFETKMPEGKVSLIQAHVHEKIHHAYGRVFVPRSVEDAVAALYEVGWVDPRRTDVKPPAAI